MVVFSVPVYLIYSISDNSKYYQEKRAADHELVLKEYQDFKVAYSRIFKSSYGLDLQYHEAFLDAPFNRVKMEEPPNGNQDDFLTDLTGHGF